MAQQQRLTDRLNLALAEASAAIAIGRDRPELAHKCCQEAEPAIEKAQKIMGEIRRAAQTI